MKIKPYYPNSILKEPYLNGFWNGIILGFSIVLIFTKYDFLAMIGIACSFLYYIIFNSNN